MTEDSSRGGFFCYMVLQLFIAAGLLWLPIDHWVYFFCVISCLMVIYVVLVKKLLSVARSLFKTKEK